MAHSPCGDVCGSHTVESCVRLTFHVVMCVAHNPCSDVCGSHSVQ